MARKPIVLLMCPRSGSSMTAGLFHLHGCWVGGCREPNFHNPKGFFENLKIKEALINHFGNCSQERRIADPRPEFWDDVEGVLGREGCKDGPWIIKTSAPYYKVFKGCPTVLIRRDSKSIIESVVRSNMLKGNAEEGVMFHQRILDELSDKHPQVYPDQVVSGNYASLEYAMNHCELEMNPDIVRGFVDGKLWTAS